MVLPRLPGISLPVLSHLPGAVLSCLTCCVLIYFHCASARTRRNRTHTVTSRQWQVALQPAISGSVDFLSLRASGRPHLKFVPLSGLHLPVVMTPSTVVPTNVCFSEMYEVGARRSGILTTHRCPSRAIRVRCPRWSVLSLAARHRDVEYRRTVDITFVGVFLFLSCEMSLLAPK